LCEKPPPSGEGVSHHFDTKEALPYTTLLPPPEEQQEERIEDPG